MNPEYLRRVAESAGSAVFGLINLRGIRATGEVAIVTVAIKVLPLIAVVAIAAILGMSGGPVHPVDVPPPSFGNIATASALCLFALTGFEFAMSPVGKIRAPERNLARALLFGLAGIAMLYLVVTLSLSLVMPNSAIARSIAHRAASRARPSRRSAANASSEQRADSWIRSST